MGGVGIVTGRVLRDVVEDVGGALDAESAVEGRWPVLLPLLAEPSPVMRSGPTAIGGSGERWAAPCEGSRRSATTGSVASPPHPSPSASPPSPPPTE